MQEPSTGQAIEAVPKYSVGDGNRFSVHVEPLNAAVVVPLTATQKEAEEHAIACASVPSTDVGALQLPPEYVTTSPFLASAAQNEAVGHETATAAVTPVGPPPLQLPSRS